MNQAFKFLTGAALLSGIAQAGDRPSVSHVSFSPDNSRVMVVTEWVQDGSGFPQSRLQVFDTAQGRSLLRVSSYSQNPSATPQSLSTQMLGNQAAKLRAAGLWNRPKSRPKLAPKASSLLPNWAEALRPGQNKTYSVFLWSRPVPITLRVKAGGSCPISLGGLLPNGERSASVSVDVNGQVIPVPASALAAAPCAARFTLDRVDLSGNRVLLTLRAYSPGFEGPNATPIFLAATLK